MNKYGRFGSLLGTLYIGNTHCKFSIYASRNAEVLTCHEVKLHQISNQPGWIEYDPIEIWKCVIESIEIATKNLIILDINPVDIIALSITNQRETTILWHKINGIPLYNAIAWNDTRTLSTLNSILAKNRNKKYYLKMICGLPFSTCFSAIKIKWIIDNIPGIRECIQNEECLFGTLDTWILWNLTGGLHDGIHITDVTNASRTMLMNLETLNWDHKLCAYFKISPKILPKIKSCSEIYGFVHSGPLHGIPIAACLGDQPASLLGQLCIHRNQATCTYDDGCFLLVNTGQEICESDNGLLTTVAFQLGPKEKPYYALEGAIANAGSAITWLHNNFSLNTNDITQNENKIINASLYGGGGESSNSLISSLYNSNTNLFDTTFSTNNNNYKTDLVLVPAFSGLYSPFWSHNSRGLILGLNNHTTSKHVTMAAYESTCLQTRDLLESITKDLPTWPQITKLIVGGEFSDNNFFLQLLADLCGITIERPQTSSPSCLGAMLAAGLAMNILSLENARVMFTPPSDQFQATMCSNQRDIKYRRWKYAIKKCINWNHFDHDGTNEIFKYEDKDPDLTIRCSIPGSIYIISSIALLFVTKYLFHKK